MSRAKKENWNIPKKLFGISFKRTGLLESALIHPSYRNENPGQKQLDDFDRLEFFGDAILNYVICKKLYRIFPEADEGLLSRLRSILVSRRILSRIAKDLGFLKWIRLGKGLEKQGVIFKKKILADSFESFLGALYFDKGLAQTEKFLLKHFDEYFDAKKLFRLDPNPKSMLQEISQRQWQRLPTYRSEVHEKGFLTMVSIDHLKKASAQGKTRQESEEKAARILIRKLRQKFVHLSKKSFSGKKLRKLS